MFSCLATNTNTGDSQSCILSPSQSLFVSVLMNLTSVGFDSTVIDNIRLDMGDWGHGDRKDAEFSSPSRELLGASPAPAGPGEIESNGCGQHDHQDRIIFSL